MISLKDEAPFATPLFNEADLRLQPVTTHASSQLEAPGLTGQTEGLQQHPSGTRH